jgi:hypothetical protein
VIPTIMAVVIMSVFMVFSPEADLFLFSLDARRSHIQDHVCTSDKSSA